MKFLRHALVALLLCSGWTTAEICAKGKLTPNIYMFGFSASFADSTVYFTNIQKMDSAWTDTKTKFLLGRDIYTYQLKEYMTHDLSLPNRTCIVMYAKNQKEADKKYAKLKKLYTVKSQGGYDVRYLTPEEFKFNDTNMFEEEEETPMTKAEKKAAKEAEKQKKKEQAKEKREKRTRPDGKGGPGMPPPNGGQRPSMH